MLESIPNVGMFLAQAADIAPDPPFYRTGWFTFLALVAAIALGWYLAKAISSSLKLAEGYNTRMSVVLIAVFVASLMIWSKWPPKLGVDLRGGINMIGSLNLDAFVEGDGFGDRPEAADIIPALIRRVNPSGTKEIMIRPLGVDKIEVTIPSVDPSEADAIWDRLVKAGKLEFRILANPNEFPAQVAAARKLAESGARGRKVMDIDADGQPKAVAMWVALARVASGDGIVRDLVPFKFVPSRDHVVRKKSTGEIIDTGSFLFSGDNDLRGFGFAKWCKQNNIRTPQILVIQPDDDQNVEGKHLVSVSSTIDERGRGSVAFKTSDEGSSRMGMLTRMNLDRPMGIVLDGQLHSAPNIESAIYKNGRITGEFTQEEVDELIINLESGKLDVALNKAPISRDFIESNLGRELKEKGFWAIGCSMILVLVFMVVYYRFAGVVATIALLLNLLLILALVMAINQPLTLTGLAGLVLTVGMSVDANVLIFERIREELDRGAALRMAIRNGFDKATTTIIDANVTTLITAIVLYVIGTEQIKGFSVTLILGILMSMFTAIFVSRLIFDIFERKGWLKKLNMTRILEKQKWNFLNKISVTSVVSIALIIAGLAGMFVLGPKILNHDLRGGSTVRMVFKEAQDVEKIREELTNLQREHNGEKVEFTVSGFGSKNKPEMADRVFKVDSNLPAWEGPPQEQFDQLADILAEVFKGRLELHHVDIEGVRATPVVPPQSSIHRNSGPSIGAMPTFGSLTTSLLTFQDQEEDGSEAEAPSSGQTPPPTTQDQIGDDSLPTDSAAQDDGQFPTAPKPSTRIQEIKVKRTLKITPTPGVSGKSLTALLVTASETAELPLEEEQIRVDSEDVKRDESVMTTISENWTVTMDVTSEEEADKILATWAAGFNNKAYFPTTSKVGGQIAGQTQLQALAAIIASLLGIIAYVWIRFQNVAFGLAAVIALVHDVLIVLGAIALSHWLAGVFGFLGVVEFKISLEIVAALLTVIGYSLNDTIVVFDRIREVRGKRQEITAEMINTSISQTLSRTILTSVTTFIVVFILYWFGGDAIHGFAFALVVGVLVGTYSSIFIASPALLWLMNTVGLNPGIVDPETA